MNSLVKICPYCKKHIQYTLDKKVIKMKCECGFSSSMNFKNIPIGHNNNPLFKEIKLDLEKGYKFLNSDFNTYKNELINNYLKQINELESAYEESYNRNINMLLYIQTLINNYDESVEMRNCILNNCIKIEQCKDNKNINELIKYYNKYNIRIESVKIEDIKSIKTITDHTNQVNFLLHRKDGRVASCSHDNTIRIYDPSNDYHCDQVIERHSECITSICQLDDGTIVSCSDDKSIMIGDYTIKNAHDDSIRKVITLPNNRIASCSKDMTIKIWKSNPPYSDTPIKVLTRHWDYAPSLLYIKERDIMISGAFDVTLRLWNMSTYQCDKVIEIKCCNTNSLYQIDKDRVIVGGVNSFSIVNIDKCIIEKRINVKSLGFVHCFLKLRDNKTILCGCKYGIFCFYDMKTEQYKITKNNHNDAITDLLLIDDNTFLSCSTDTTIKVWRY